MHIEPLTHCGGDGQIYYRAPQVTQQIEVALQLAPDVLIERVRIQHYTAPEYFQEECLVYLIRHYHRQRADQVVNALTEMLLHRCANFVNKRVGTFGSDAFSDVVTWLFSKILDLNSDRGDFLQVRFWFALKQLCISAFRQYEKMEARMERTVPLTDLVGYDSDEPDEASPPSIPASDVIHVPITVEQQLLLQEGLQTIPEPQRTAFLLRLNGWPIESSDPSEPSISKIFGRTPRMIRYWLETAEKKLAAWREDNDE